MVAFRLEHLLVVLAEAVVVEAQQLVLMVLQILAEAVEAEAITAQVVHRKVAVAVALEL